MYSYPSKIEKQTNDLGKPVKAWLSFDIHNAKRAIRMNVQIIQPPRLVAEADSGDPSFHAQINIPNFLLKSFSPRCCMRRQSVATSPREHKSFLGFCFEKIICRLPCIRKYTQAVPVIMKDTYPPYGVPPPVVRMNHTLLLLYE